MFKLNRFSFKQLLPFFDKYEVIIGHTKQRSLLSPWQSITSINLEKEAWLAAAL